MAPTRKSKSAKRYSTVTEASPEKYGRGSSKKKQRKRKLSDTLGPQWSKGELERFYDAYRKYGKEWRKVAAAVRNRSTDMVESLYNMNRAYLSLPEGTASVVGLIAMMTDHYNVLDGSDSERESNDALVFSRKPQKRKLGKDQISASKDIFQSHSSVSLEGCLSLLKKRRLDGYQPRAVGKRTPRYPVTYKKDDRQTYVSPIRRGRKSGADNDDEVAHVAALLTEASQRGGSPQVSQSPYRRSVHIKSSSAQSSERMHPPPGKARASLCDASMDEDWLEGSIGSRGAETGDYARDLLEGVGTVEIHRKGKKFYGKKEKVKDIGNHQFDDGGEACSGTEEGLNGSSRGKDDYEVSNTRGERSSPQGQRKRSKKLYFGDDSSCLDALQTLADLSLMMPESTMESGSSVQLKEEGTNFDGEDKFSVPEATSTRQTKNKSKPLGAKQRAPFAISAVEGTNPQKSKLGRDPAFDINSVSESELQLQSTTKIWKKKRKSSVPKNADAHRESDVNEPSNTEGFSEEENKPLTKGKRTSQMSTPSKQWKSARSLDGSLNSDYRRPGTDLMVSTAQVLISSKDSLPEKRISRRKLYTPRTLHPKEKTTEKKSKHQLNIRSSSVHDRALYLKEKISSCLSSHLVRRWCTFEWFYSALDYPWFSKREFEEYLNHVGLGHIPRLTRVEWGVIRSSLGKPRRFSEHFLCEERDKLKQYRESVRKHYAELRAGVREGLPTDLARPLSVGQRVIALHPKTREVHDGSVLTVDHDKCRVQFDRPDIGVEFVMDVDCMPLNPLDNMPEALRRQNIAFDKFSLASKEPNKNGNLNFGGSMMTAPSGHPEKATPMNASLKQGKGDTDHETSQPKGSSADIVRAQQAAYIQPGMVPSHNQAREADIRALSELTRALDKKEALLTELRNTNNNFLENQNSGECSLKDSEPFKKHYAMVLVQLKEASGQVSSAVVNLRQRNTYPANSVPPWMKYPANSTVYGGLPSSFDSSISQESGSSVNEIVEVSRSKAQMMVKAAIQAMSSRKGGEDAYARIREALEFEDNQNIRPDPRLSISKHQELLINGNLDPSLTNVLSSSKSNTDSDKNEPQILSEVITACVMAVHMIQTCTERQFPPAVVAQVLDHAVTSLHPRSPQNVGMYREIQMCMGRIKTQILALVPT